MKTFFTIQSFFNTIFKRALDLHLSLVSLQIIWFQVAPEDIEVVFDDVKGCDEAKKELQEIVEFLMNPEKFSKLGGKLPKGVLLSGKA